MQNSISALSKANMKRSKVSLEPNEATEIGKQVLKLSKEKSPERFKIEIVRNLIRDQIDPLYDELTLYNGGLDPNM